MNESDLTEKICSNASPRFKEAIIKPRTQFIKRKRRSTVDPVKISTTYDIIGHSDTPFQQRKNFYPELNYTDIIVEAHNVSVIQCVVNKMTLFLTYI